MIGGVEFRRLVRLAPYSAKERLRRAIIACGGNIAAVGVVLGYSARAERAIHRYIREFDLGDELREARRRARMKTRGGKPTKSSADIERRNRRMIEDAERKARKAAEKRAEIHRLANFVE